MSNDDFVVDPLTDSEIRENAKRVRRFLGVADARRVDPLMLEHVTEIWTIRGVKPFRFVTVADDKLPRDAGLTTYDGSKILIQYPRRIRHDAFLGDGFARYTLAHELGHATHHFDKLVRGAVMPRRSAGNVTPIWIPKFKSAEHQAMVFGAAFLINDEIGRQLNSPEEISVELGVSLKAARIYFEQTREEIERPASALRVRKMADEFKASVVEELSPKPKINFLNDPCSSCGQ